MFDYEVWKLRNRTTLFSAEQAKIAAIHECSGVADQAVRVPTSR
jgi:hypothetical protein